MSQYFIERKVSSNIRASISIPFHLREKFNDEKQITVIIQDERPTVRSLLKYIKEQLPFLSQTILNEKDELCSYISLYLNEKNVRQLEDLDTPIEREENNIVFRASIAGG